jgi:CrcB protein
VTVLLVAMGAALGAPTRYLVGQAVRSPWGTFLVNVVGCLVLGAVAGSGRAPAGVVALVGTGFCGALTTYSTFSWETLRLAEEEAWWRPVAYVLGSTAAGLAAAALGWSLS